MDATLTEILSTVGVTVFVLGAVGWFVLSRSVSTLQQSILAQLEANLTIERDRVLAELDRRRNVDLDLRNKRADSHVELWRITRRLPLWPKDDKLTRKELYKLSEELRDWYFDGGGLYLSEEARDQYGDAQRIVLEHSDQTSDEPLRPEEYDAAREACSSLRTELTADLQSRERL